MITEDDFRDALHEQVRPFFADVQPEPGLLESLRRRQSRRNGLRVGGAGFAVAAVAVGATLLVTLSPGDHAGRVVPPTGSVESSGPSPAATGGDIALVTTGDCAGLTVTAAVQSTGWPTWRIAPGSTANAITVPAGVLMYLHASGPCVDALTFHTSGDLLQGADPNASTSHFDSQGIGVVVSHKPAQPGTQMIELWLGCAGSGAICNGNPRELAAITVAVTPRATAVPSAATAVPNVLGMTGPQAEQTLSAAGFTVVQHVGSAVSTPVGVVVAQSPVSGDAVPGSTVTIVVSNGPPPPACSASVLAFDYRGVTLGTGMNTAPIEIRNTSSHACTLVGPLTVVGLDVAGQPVTNEQTYAAAPDLLLTADGPKLNAGDSVPAGASVAAIPLSAQIRDTGGECANTVVAASWRISIGGAITVLANGDGKLPQDVADQESGALGACGGKLTHSVGEMITSLG